MSGIGESFARIVSDGPFVVAALVAAVAGLVSFLSPCVLPLVPGYLSYVGGLSGTEAASSAPAPAEGGGVAVATRTRRLRSRTVLGAVLFVLGFTVVFVAYGVLFGRLGSLLIEHQRGLERILGVIVILLGLAFLGVIPGVSRELRIHRFPAAGLAGAPLLGVVFGLGWTPCIGPTLGAVQSLALSTAGAGRGAALSVAYCLGLGVPFVLVALGARWLIGALGIVRRHANIITYVGGGLLVVLGLLLVTGLWGQMTIELTSRVGQSGLGTSL
ncbi:MAG TPA: cytochrome c biogenesis protein CcdA [Mycobacteriales bacterium]|jgi:cytochrome c-type biogenesis protein|nr:cytochrome c biogenesis protein CcdA [Mycobacteriales bacterium]